MSCEYGLGPPSLANNQPNQAPQPPDQSQPPALSPPQAIPQQNLNSRSPPQQPNTIPMTPAELVSFGRLGTEFRIVDRVIQIDNQDELPRATWRQLDQLAFDNLPITEKEFIRQWKTILLKRVQDVYEQEKHCRADNRIQLSRNMVVPAPLADLLYSIGSYFDPIEQVFHHVIPPAYPAAPQPWWQIDNQILQNWSIAINRMSSAFVMKEYPPAAQYKGTALIHTVIVDQHGSRTIRARYKSPTPADAYIRFVNDELFVNPYNAADCPYTMAGPMSRTAVTYDYLPNK